MNKEEINQAIFEFLIENISLEEYTEWGGSKYVRLRIMNPSTKEWEYPSSSDNYICIKKGERYY